MKSTAKTVTLGLLSLLVLAAAACERDPLALEDSTPQFAKGDT